MKIHSITDKKFQKYGSIVQGYDFSQLLDEMRKIPIPQEGIDYVASESGLEALPVFEQIQSGFYGGMPAALGYCMGHNQKLNALEYHRGSELNIAVTDYIVLIGSLQDVDEEFNYDTSLVEAFYVPAGAAVEFYATTLHYCACHVQEEGYAHATFLPKGTNTPLEEGFVPRTEEDKLLLEKNKWMLVHAEGGFGPEVPVKLKGENLKINASDWKEKRS